MRSRSGVIALVVAAIASVALMLRAGSRNPSSLLRILFVGWVLLPFVGLAWADAKSATWSDLSQRTLRLLMIAVPVMSLSVYIRFAIWPRRSQPAAVFLVVPFASWVVTVFALSLAALVARWRPAAHP